MRWRDQARRPVEAVALIGHQPSMPTSNTRLVDRPVAAGLPIGGQRPPVFARSGTALRVHGSLTAPDKCLPSKTMCRTTLKWRRAARSIDRLRIGEVPFFHVNSPLCVFQPDGQKSVPR